jgi:hypothetical protein
VLLAGAGLLSKHHSTGATTVIAEAPAPSAVQESTAAQSDIPAPLSLNRIVAALQVMLATRRAARNEEHAYWYTVARGM